MGDQDRRLTKLTSRLMPRYTSCWALHSTGGAPDWNRAHDALAHLDWPTRSSGFSFEDLVAVLASPSADEARGTILVTGFRGTGKTSYVERAMFLAAQRLHHAWERGKRPLPLLLPIRISIPRPITDGDLLRRAVRALYSAMVDHCVGDFAPEAMLEARVAYLRTLGTVKTTESTEHRAKFATELGFSLDKLKDIKLSAEEEWKLAKSLEVTFGRTGPEEAEDQLAAISQALVQATGTKGLVARTLTSLNEMTKEARKYLAGAQVEIRPVFVFDELDKLDEEIAVPPGSAAGSTEAKLCAVCHVVATLKTVLATTRGTFIFITGAKEEQTWLSDQAAANALYPSLFGRRVYAPLVWSPDALWAVVQSLAGGPEPGEDGAEAPPPGSQTIKLATAKKALVFLSGGVVRSALRVVADSALTFSETAVSLRSPSVLAEWEGAAARFDEQERAWKAVSGWPLLHEQASASSSAYQEDAERLVLHAALSATSPGLAKLRLRFPAPAGDSLSELYTAGELGADSRSQLHKAVMASLAVGCAGSLGLPQLLVERLILAAFEALPARTADAALEPLEEDEPDGVVDVPPEDL